MYSQTAIQLYAEMLKAASSAVAPQFEKSAAGLGINHLFRPTPLPGLANLGGAVQAGAAKPGMISRLGAVAQAGASRLGGAVQTGAAKSRSALSQLFTRAPRAAPGPQLNPFQLPNIGGDDLMKELMGDALKPAPVVGTGRMLGAGLLGGATLGAGGYALGRNTNQQQTKTQRNMAFGAGAAAGLVAPSILRSVADTAQTVALSPSNLIPRRY